MITITPTAAQQLKLILLTEYPDSEGIRLSVRGGGCSGYEFGMDIVGIGEMRAIDRKHNISGVPVVIDQMSALYMDNATLDWTQDLMKCGFSFSIPGSRSCGCGRSFSA